MKKKTIIIAEDWKALARKDGSVFLTCGEPNGSYHMAFDVPFKDLQLAERFADAMNYYNKGVYHV